MALDKAAIGREGTVITYVIDASEVRAFADAIGDPSPVYRDPAAALAAGHPAIPAPPTFATCRRGSDDVRDDLDPDCRVDDDCGRNEVCDGGECVPDDPDPPMCAEVEVGAECRADRDCGDGRCDRGMEDGYCTVDFEDGECCPEGSRNLDTAWGNICLDSCNRDSDCRDEDGYECLDLEDGAICWTCHTSVNVIPVGGPCEDDEDCLGGEDPIDSAWCITEADDDRFPGGYCTIQGGLWCCPEGSESFDVGGEDNRLLVCLDYCDRQSDCRDGYDCQEVGDNSVCWLQAEDG